MGLIENHTQKKKDGWIRVGVWFLLGVEPEEVADWIATHSETEAFQRHGHLTLIYILLRARSCV